MKDGTRTHRPQTCCHQTATHKSGRGRSGWSRCTHRLKIMCVSIDEPRRSNSEDIPGLSARATSREAEAALTSLIMAKRPMVAAKRAFESLNIIVGDSVGKKGLRVEELGR